MSTSPIQLIPFLLVMVAFCVTSSCATHSRIMSGEDAKRHQFPHMVSLQRRKEHRCGGVVLSPNWVLTAAHCLPIPGPHEILAGALDQNETHADNQRVSVEEYIKHPKYKLPYYDAAMVKLSTPLKFGDAVKAIKLPKADQEFNGSVILSGWGQKSVNGTWLLPNTLQQLEMDLISVEECNKLLKTANYPYDVYDNMICSLPRKAKQSACYRDSGSPLVQDDVVVGIANSVDVKCGQTLEKPSPTVHTRITSVLDFIEETMAKYS